MSRLSDAQKRAKNKYNKKAYKQFNVKLKPFQMKILEDYCNKYSHGKNSFAILALKEKMERDTGKSFDEFLKESEEIKSSSSGDTPSSLETENKKES